MGEAETKRCPVCGRGVLRDITYREGEPAPGAAEPTQTPETRQVETYSCGHEVTGPKLEQTAGVAGDLEVERRQSDETVEPL